MIGFATLLFGLVIGKFQVVLVVSPDVASVERRLDGREIGRLTRSPWVFPCDFGPELHPHELTAIAYDRENREIAPASRRVNVPHPETEAQLVLERSGSRVVAAHLTWDNSGRAERPKVRVALDGRPLAARKKAPTAFAIPSYDPEQAHVLTAELEFSGDRRAVANTAFGGSLADEVRTALTAVPVLPDPGSTLRRAEELRGFFAEDGKPVRVMAVEATPARVALVLDQDVRERLRGRPWAPERGSLGYPRIGASIWSSPPHSPESSIDLFRPARPGDDSLDLVFAVSGPSQGHPWEVRSLFPVHRGLALESDSFSAQLPSLIFPNEPADQQSLADAVAVAGVNAATRNECHAVVLIVSGRLAADSSTLSETAALAFLSDLRVPFEVWTMSLDREDESPVTPWGRARRASTPQMLRSRLEELRDRLHNQRIVWLDGAHLPQRIQLTARSKGIKIAM